MRMNIWSVVIILVIVVVLFVFDWGWAFRSFSVGLIAIAVQIFFQTRDKVNLLINCNAILLIDKNGCGQQCTFGIKVVNIGESVTISGISVVVPGLGGRFVLTEGYWVNNRDRYLPVRVDQRSSITIILNRDVWNDLRFKISCFVLETECGRSFSVGKELFRSRDRESALFS